MQRVKFDMDRAVIVRRVVDDDRFFLFPTRCGQEIRINKEGLSIETHPEIDADTSFAVLDVLTRQGTEATAAILAAAESTTLEALFRDSRVSFPGLRCAFVTPA